MVLVDKHMIDFLTLNTHICFGDCTAPRSIQSTKLTHLGKSKSSMYILDMLKITALCSTP